MKFLTFFILLGTLQAFAQLKPLNLKLSLKSGHSVTAEEEKRITMMATRQLWFRNYSVNLNTNEKTSAQLDIEYAPSISKNGDRSCELTISGNVLSFSGSKTYRKNIPSKALSDDRFSDELSRGAVFLACEPLIAELTDGNQIVLDP